MATTADRHVVSFMVGGGEYAIDILQVQEIIRLVGITAIPKAPAFVKGIINLRGQVLPVIDLRERFAQAGARDDNETRIIIVQMINRNVGLIVDKVREVIRVPAAAVENPPDIVMNVESRFIAAVGKLGPERMLAFLNLDEILTTGEKKQMTVPE